jgi:hypothetical protein
LGTGAGAAAGVAAGAVATEGAAVVTEAAAGATTSDAAAAGAAVWAIAGVPNPSKPKPKIKDAINFFMLFTLL